MSVSSEVVTSDIYDEFFFPRAPLTRIELFAEMQVLIRISYSGIQEKTVGGSQPSQRGILIIVTFRPRRSRKPVRTRKGGQGADSSQIASP